MENTKLQRLHPNHGLIKMPNWNWKVRLFNWNKLFQMIKWFTSLCNWPFGLQLINKLSMTMNGTMSPMQQRDFHNDKKKEFSDSEFLNENRGCFHHHHFVWVDDSLLTRFRRFFFLAMFKCMFFLWFLKLFLDLISVCFSKGNEAREREISSFQFSSAFSISSSLVSVWIIEKW